MVDLPKIKKAATGEMPPPAPAPASDMDLPAPAPPMRPEANLEQAAPAPPAMPSPVPKERMAAPPVPAPPAGGGVDALKPLAEHARGKAAGFASATESVGIQGSPPVFIKIDKYIDIVRNLQKLKSYAMSLRDALDALADIEKELTTGISISHKALDDFNSIIALLDSKLLRVSAIHDTDAGPSGDMDNYIKGIYEQMERIKAELKGIEQ